MIYSDLKKIKNMTDKMMDYLTPMSKFPSYHTVVLKGQTGNEQVYSTVDYDYVLQQSLTYDLTPYKKLEYKYFQIYGKWLLRTSDENYTSKLKVWIEWNFSDGYVYSYSKEYGTTSTIYEEIYYDITNYYHHRDKLNSIKLKWYLSWTGGTIYIIIPEPEPPPGGIPGLSPPPPPSAPSTAYSKFMYFVISFIQ